jgi:hypothetical protein
VKVSFVSNERWEDEESYVILFVMFYLILGNLRVRGTSLLCIFIE